MKSDLEEIWGYKPGEWVWCLHCERFYKVGEYREVVVGKRKKEVYQLCPYPDCDGTPLDVFKRNIDYEPVRGKVYPMLEET